MTVKLINQKIFEGNTKVLDDIIHVCIGGKWYKLFAGDRIRDVRFEDDSMIFTSDYVSEYDLSRHMDMQYVLDGSKSAFVISNYNSPPMKGNGMLIRVDELMGGSYIDTALHKFSPSKHTDEELNRQIVWIEPNFEVVKENENESSN